MVVADLERLAVGRRSWCAMATVYYLALVVVAFIIFRSTTGDHFFVLAAN